MDFRAVFMGVVFVAMWSSAFSSARIIVADAPPLWTLGARFVISGLLAVALARMLGQSWNLSRDQWRATVVFGLCQNVVYLGANFVAMQWVEASLAAIIASSMPLLVALLGWLSGGARPRGVTLLGLSAGMAGVVLIMGARLSGGVDMLGLALCATGALALAVATLVLRGATSGGNILMITGLQMLVAAGILLGVAALFEAPEVTYSPRLAWAFAFTTIVPGLMATVIWMTLVERIGTIRAAAYHFLNPFFGVFFAWLILDESLGLTDMIGVLVISVGIFLVQRARQSQTG